MRVVYFISAILLIQAEQHTRCSLNQKFCSMLTILNQVDIFIEEFIDILSKDDIECQKNVKNIPPSKIAHPKDCTELMQKGIKVSGIYEVQPENRSAEPISFKVYCDMETDGGGWTVFQRRGNFGHPRDYFFRNWRNYSEGFGNLDEDFWLGNDKIHSITNQGKYSLRVDLQDWDNSTVYAHYYSFKIGSEKDLYQLHVSGYSGNSSDSLSVVHDGRKFSTFDNDNDASPRDCSYIFKGGWWYNDCYKVNLNGLYYGLLTSKSNGVIWRNWQRYTLRSVEMKMRRIE